MNISMTAKQSTARVAAHRARKAAAGLAEVRGIWAPPAEHQMIKENANMKLQQQAESLARTKAQLGKEVMHVVSIGPEFFAIQDRYVDSYLASKPGSQVVATFDPASGRKYGVDNHQMNVR